jgi:hypothetical protein
MKPNIIAIQWILLERQDEMAISNAAMYGNLDIVQEIMKQSKQNYFPWCLIDAVKNNHYDVVNFLVAAENFNEDSLQALLNIAVKYNYFDIARLLAIKKS